MDSTNKYRYFRIINNVTDDLSLFIIMKRITHDNDEHNLYSYIFFLRPANENLIPINDINKILLDKKIKIKFSSILETVVTTSLALPSTTPPRRSAICFAENSI